MGTTQIEAQTIVDAVLEGDLQAGEVVEALGILLRIGIANARDMRIGMLTRHMRYTETRWRSFVAAWRRFETLCRDAEDAGISVAEDEAEKEE